MADIPSTNQQAGGQSEPTPEYDKVISSENGAFDLLKSAD
jgi:hypothetical protein